MNLLSLVRRSKSAKHDISHAKLADRKMKAVYKTAFANFRKDKRVAGVGKDDSARFDRFVRRLLNLPPELRFQIYDYVLRSNKHSRLDAWEHRYRTTAGFKVLDFFPPSLSYGLARRLWAAFPSQDVENLIADMFTAFAEGYVIDLRGFLILEELTFANGYVPPWPLKEADRDECLKLWLEYIRKAELNIRVRDQFLIADCQNDGVRFRAALPGRLERLQRVADMLKLAPSLEDLSVTLLIEQQDLNSFLQYSMASKTLLELFQPLIKIPSVRRIAITGRRRDPFRPPPDPVFVWKRELESA